MRAKVAKKQLLLLQRSITPDLFSQANRLFFTFVPAMLPDIPDHNYFLTADGTYCHLLPDKVIIGQRNEIEFMPVMDHNNRKAMHFLVIGLLILFAAGITLMYFFDRMIPEMVAGVWMVVIAASYRLYLLRDTSSSECIEKRTIRSTKLVERFMGYTTWVIFFTTDKGEKLRRMVKIYDSKEHEARAARILKAEGFI
jgi:hypothetical protein